jgi:hypothetical protein
MKERLQSTHGEDLIHGVEHLIRENFILKTSKAKKQQRRLMRGRKKKK